MTDLPSQTFLKITFLTSLCQGYCDVLRLVENMVDNHFRYLFSKTMVAFNIKLFHFSPPIIFENICFIYQNGFLLVPEASPVLFVCLYICLSVFLLHFLIINALFSFDASVRLLILLYLFL